MVDFIPIRYALLNIQNIFIVFFLLAGLLLLINRIVHPNKFLLNISKPQVFIFEYESHEKRVFSLYNILNIFSGIIINALFVFSIVFFVNKLYFTVDFSFKFFLNIIWLVLGMYFYAFVVDFFISWRYKKINNISRIKQIRLAFLTYNNLYLFVISFFVFFFPVINKISFSFLMLFFILIFSLSSIKYLESLKMHINFKTYQLFLYLCLLEILPILFVIYWISFHIL